MFLTHRTRRLANKSAWTDRCPLWAFVSSMAMLLLVGSAQIARAADGDLDPSFGTGGKLIVQIAAQKRDFARAVAVNPDGTIIVGGELGDFSSNTNSSVLVRLNPDG